MTIFQVFLIIIVAVAAVFALRLIAGDKSLAIKRIAMIAFSFGALIAIAFPELLTRVANFFGIGRGVDLLLYLFIIATLLYAIASARSQARKDARLTELARAVALMEARLREQQNHDNHSSSGDNS